MQGIFLSIEALTNKRRTLFEKKYKLNNKALYLLICMAITFILFASSQVFARAASIGDAFMVYRKIFSVQGSPYLDLTTLAYSMFGLLIILLKDFKDEFYSGRLLFFSNRRILVRYFSYLFILFLVLLLGVFEGTQFIYFQF